MLVVIIDTLELIYNIWYKNGTFGIFNSHAVHHKPHAIIFLLAVVTLTVGCIFAINYHTYLSKDLFDSLYTILQ